MIAGRSQEKLDAAKASISGEVQSYSLDFTDESLAVVFLVSNGYVTGTVLDIDGGAKL